MEDRRWLAGAVAEEEEREWAALVAAVDAVAADGAPVFVGCEGHERLLMNNALLYVLLGRPVAVRTHCFRPGVTTTEAEQRLILAELEAVSVVVLAEQLFWTEPNRSAEVGSALLDEGLERAFRTRATVGPYRALVRR